MPTCSIIFPLKMEQVLDRSAIRSSNRHCPFDSSDSHLPFAKAPPLKIMNIERRSNMEDEYIRTHHRHMVKDNQCSSSLVKLIKAPVNLVWSLVRRFDQPQRYKPFVSRCVVQGDLEIGSVREVNVRSGLPATTSKERLELLDDEEHIFAVKIVGGDHRLRNYSSIITVHPEVIDGRPGTIVIESFVVDVPDGNTQDETCFFVEALIRCNLKSLADVSERLALQGHTEPIDPI
ncbi:Abscisic acid receptor PYL10 [Capsicum annuum]|uniref:Abscisic acid receptor PYL10 n=1 Tax=Capsicum annuum TaxID=4072 RepID=A0A1U8F839_CAPAN|nr:abscisic acid receptor PYL9 [Capsicum annuum]PHT66162.1 Abscisic acid receptor PYL10 [Capsicum annuum]